MKPNHRVGISVFGLFIGWGLLSAINSQYFPSPVTIAVLAVELVVEGDVRHSAAYHIGVTFGRVLLATAISLSLAVGIGVAMYLNESVAKAVEAWLPIWMTPPDVVVILIVMVIFGFTTPSIVIAVSFVCTPFALVSIWEGLQDITPELVEMGETFDAGPGMMWRFVYLPYVGSYIFASLRNLFGMTWKVAVIGEVFGITNGVGARIRYWFLQSNIEEVVAYTALFTIVVLFIEYGVLRPVEERAFKWRTTA